MKQVILPVTVHLNIRLPLALLQPESADAPVGPEPETHACQGCGNCIALDDGAECVCVQSISCSLLCRCFRAAVLPLERVPPLSGSFYPSVLPEDGYRAGD